MTQYGDGWSCIVPNTPGDYWVSFPVDSNRTKYTKPKIITLELVWDGDHEEMLYVAEPHVGLDYLVPVRYAMYKPAQIPHLPDTKKMDEQNAVYKPLKDGAVIHIVDSINDPNTKIVCDIYIGENNVFKMFIVETRADGTQTVSIPSVRLPSDYAFCRLKNDE